MILKEHFVTACFVQYPESAVTISVTLGMQDFFDVAVIGSSTDSFYFFTRTRCTVGVPSLS